MKFENDKDSFETYSNILHEIARVLIGRIDTIKDMNSLLTMESLNMTQTNMKVFFENTMKSMSYLFEITDSINFKYILEIPENLIVIFDEDRYRRCLENFINNAMKYTAEGNILIHSYIKDKFLYTSIEDTGKGIPETHIKD